MRHLVLSFFLCYSIPSFCQETQVNILLSDLSKQKESIYASIDNNTYRLEGEGSAQVETIAEMPVKMSILKIKSNGKITENRSFWVFDDEYQITGIADDFSTIQIQPNHPYNLIMDDFNVADVDEKKKIIDRNIEKVIGLQLLSSNMTIYSDEELQDLIARIPESLHDSEYYKSTKTFLLTKNSKKPKVGSKAVDFELESRTGEMISLSDFEGKYKLLEFSFTGCMPCIEALPEIKEAYERHNSKLEVISVWNDKTKDIWLNTAKKHKEQITWIDLWDEEGYATSLYQIKVWPNYILINPEGEIVEIWNSYRKGKLLRELESFF